MGSCGGRCAAVASTHLHGLCLGCAESVGLGLTWEVARAEEMDLEVAHLHLGPPLRQRSEHALAVSAPPEHAEHASGCRA